MTAWSISSYITGRDGANIFIRASPTKTDGPQTMPMEPVVCPGSEIMSAFTPKSLRLSPSLRRYVGINSGTTFILGSAFEKNIIAFPIRPSVFICSAFLSKISSSSPSPMATGIFSSSDKNAAF